MELHIVCSLYGSMVYGRGHLMLAVGVKPRVTGSKPACVSANITHKTHSVRTWLGAVWGLGGITCEFS